MGMPVPPVPDVHRRWTADEVRALIDPDRAWPRYELIDGELLVTSAPIPRHQITVFLLARALAEYVDATHIGRLYLSPADIVLAPGSLLQPDIFIVPRHVGPLGASWTPVDGLLLAVEVLSPSTARNDRIKKRRFFRRVGVPDYWVVDTEQRIVEQSSRGEERVELLDERLAWHPGGAADPFELDLAAFFERVDADES